MKKVLNLLPYGCLLSYLALCHFRTPNIADALILIAVTGLVGYTKYIKSKQAPDYLKLFGNEITRLQKEVQEAKLANNQLNIQKIRENNEIRF